MGTIPTRLGAITSGNYDAGDARDERDNRDDDDYDECDDDDDRDDRCKMTNKVSRN